MEARQGHFLQEGTLFDEGFFNISPREARNIDVSFSAILHVMRPHFPLTYSHNTGSCLRLLLTVLMMQATKLAKKEAKVAGTNREWVYLLALRTLAMKSESS